MVELLARQLKEEFIEPEWTPLSDPHQVIKWSKTAGELNGGQRSKALKLVQYNCIQYLGDNIFLSLPIDTHSSMEYAGRTFYKVAADKDYNKDPTPYRMHRLLGSDEFVCTCQWNTKMHLPCAHILALKLCFKMRKFGGKNNGST